VRVPWVAPSGAEGLCPAWEETGRCSQPVRGDGRVRGAAVESAGHGREPEHGLERPEAPMSGAFREGRQLRCGGWGLDLVLGPGIWHYVPVAWRAL